VEKYIPVASILVLALFACSGSSNDGGTAPASSAAPDAAAPDGASPDAAAPPEAGAAGPCAFGLGGNRSVPPTNATNGCNQGYIAQHLGQGDYSLRLGGSLSVGGGTVTIACQLDSPTAPAAGAKWALTTGSGGNCQVDEIVGTNDTIWSASTASKDGAATVTIVSATLTPSTVNPKDVVYLYEATLDARLPGRTAGATELTVTGNVKYTRLPPGI